VENHTTNALSALKQNALSVNNLNTVFSNEKTVSSSPLEEELVYEEVGTTYKPLPINKKKRVLTDKQKKFLSNSELYQHFSKTARDLGLSVFEKEGGGNAKMAKQAEHFLGIEETKKLIEYYLKSCEGKPISFKACLCEFNLVNWKNNKPINYEDKKGGVFQV
jgi:hypothetical protein